MAIRLFVYTNSRFPFYFINKPNVCPRSVFVSARPAVQSDCSIWSRELTHLGVECRCLCRIHQQCLPLPQNNVGTLVCGPDNDIEHHRFTELVVGVCRSVHSLWRIYSVSSSGESYCSHCVSDLLGGRKVLIQSKHCHIGIPLPKCCSARIN